MPNWILIWWMFKAHFNANRRSYITSIVSFIVMVLVFLALMLWALSHVF